MDLEEESSTLKEVIIEEEVGEEKSARFGGRCCRVHGSQTQGPILIYVVGFISIAESGRHGDLVPRSGPSDGPREGGPRGGPAGGEYPLG
jgi:hypothetical protein